MSAPCRRWKKPAVALKLLFTLGLVELTQLQTSFNLVLFGGDPVFNDGPDSRSHRNPAPCRSGFAVGNVDSAITDVLDPQSKAFFWPQTAIEKDCSDIP